MSNTMKSVIFIISMFVFLLYFYITSLFIVPFMTTLSPAMFSILSSIDVTIGFILLLYTQAVMRYLYINKRLDRNAILLTFAVKPFKRSDRFFIYAFPFIIIAASIIQNKALTNGNLVNIAIFIAFAVVLELLFFIHTRSMRIYATNKGFFIIGMDIRMELPVPTHYENASGFYPFEKIDAFLLLDGSIQLYHHYDIGLIKIPCTSEEARQIKGLLVANKIPDKRF